MLSLLKSLLWYIKFSRCFRLSWLVVHTYGPGKTFITVHVEVDAANNVLESHNLIDSIERY